MAAFSQRTTLGRTGLQVSKLGLGSSFKAPTSAYLEAFDRGVNYFYWGSIRRSLMGNAIREIARDRRDQLVVGQSARVPRVLDADLVHAAAAALAQAVVELRDQVLQPVGPGRQQLPLELGVPVVALLAQVR